MADTRDEIVRITALANISIDPSKKRFLEDDFASIISFVDDIHRADTSETSATDQVTDLENVFRSDDVVEFPHHRTMLETMPHHDAGLYRVPGVFADDEEDDGS